MTWLLLVWAGLSHAEGLGAPVAGRVLDRTSGRPLPGTVLLVRGTPITARADSSGRFTLKDLSPGRYVLEARMVGYRSASLKLDVQALRQTEPAETIVALQLSPLELAEMTVTAQRTERLAAEQSAMSVRVIPSETFEGQVSTLSEVLSRSSGVQIRTLGGLGGFSTVSIRGTTSEQVKVYLDGISLNSALGGGVNLGDIPLSNVDRIEVYKGSIPARFGGGAIGGVVNILTRDTKTRYAQGAASWGSFGSGLGHVLLSQRGDHVGFVAGADYARSNNTFPFLDDNATPRNPDDDVWTHWQNNDFASLALLAKLSVAAPCGLTFSLSHNTHGSERGVPGTATLQSRFATLRTTRNLTEAHMLRTDPLFGRLGLDLMAFRSTFASRFRDLEAEVGLGRQDNHNLTTSHGVKLGGTLLIGRAQILSLFALAQHERFHPEDRLQDAALPHNSRTTLGCAAEDEIALLGGRLNLLPGIQWDRYESDFSGDLTQGRWIAADSEPAPQALLGRHLGVKYRLCAWASVKANVGKYFRPPSFYELFGDKGWTIGNTDLEPEEGLNTDIGLRAESTAQRGNRAVVELTCFASHLDNLIQFIQYSQKEVFKPDNIGEARVNGLEAMASWTLLGRVAVEANYTYQQALNRSTLYGGIYSGKHLPNKPDHDFSGRLELFGQRHGRVFYEYAASSETYRDRYSKVLVPRRAVHNVGGTLYLLSGKVHATLEAKNLTDDQVADLWGHPLPGRSYYVTVRGAL